MFYRFSGFFFSLTAFFVFSSSFSRFTVLFSRKKNRKNGEKKTVKKQKAKIKVR
jgi:hypothetical protein